MDTPWLMLGDCLERMKDIPSGSVDMILCDLPYGTTPLKWDVVIPLDKLWEQYNRVLKPNAACVLFAVQPFTSALVMSNLKQFRYLWVWKKSHVTGFANAKHRPLKAHEDILVFSEGFARPNAKEKAMPYNPQGLIACAKSIKVNPRDAAATWRESKVQAESYIREFTNYPRDILEFSGERGLHPTQKPVPLLEYLIKTYTNEGDIVLDNCMGSGSTGVACASTRRKFVGIEKEEKYFLLAQSRMLNVAEPLFDEA